MSVVSGDRVPYTCRRCGRPTVAVIETVSTRRDQFVASGPVFFTDDTGAKYQRCPGCGANLHAEGFRSRSA